MPGLLSGCLTLLTLTLADRCLQRDQMPSFPGKAGLSSLSAGPLCPDAYLAGGSLTASLPDFREGYIEVMLNHSVSFERENAHPAKEYMSFRNYYPKNLWQVEGDRASISLSDRCRNRDTK